MNDISILLYLADISGTLKVMGIMFGMMMLLLAGALYGPVASECPVSEEEVWRSRGVKCLWGAAVLFLVGALMPSSDTMYMIIGAEVGEEVLESETSNKALQAVNAWLDRQIEGEQSED